MEGRQASPKAVESSQLERYRVGERGTRCVSASRKVCKSQYTVSKRSHDPRGFPCFRSLFYGYQKVTSTVSIQRVTAYALGFYLRV